MKKLLLSATALVALTAAASAADLPSRRAPAPIIAAAPLFTWTGFYVGAQAGYAWGEDESRVLANGVDVTDDFLGFFGDVGSDYDVDGFVGGVHAGYNVQFGSFVVGIEGDIEAAGIEGDRTWGVAGNSISAETEINFQGSIRARAGVAFDRALIYATGGLAFANIENTYTDVAGATTIVDEFDDTQWGWTLGAGVEYAFTNNLTARVEYRYTQFDSFGNDFGGGDTVEQEPDFHTVRVGVSYKFGSY